MRIWILSTRKELQQTAASPIAVEQNLRPVRVLLRQENGVLLQIAQTVVISLKSLLTLFSTKLTKLQVKTHICFGLVTVQHMTTPG